MTGPANENPPADRRATGKGRVLGKGLSALIQGADLPLVRAEGRQVREVPLEQLAYNPEQPRKTFQQDKLEELAASLKDVGMLQPILVRPLDGEDLAAMAEGEGRYVGPARTGGGSNGDVRYVVVAGERRVRAARLAGLATVPALICSFEETEALRVALLENIQRENLGPIEEAGAFQALLAAYGATQDELADMLGKSRSTVSNSLRLLTLEDELRDMVEEGLLTRGHAKALLSLPAGPDRLRLARLCRSRGLSVREVERRAQGTLAARERSRRKRGAAGRRSADRGSPEIRALQERAEEHFGAPVEIERRADGQGRLTLTFYGDDDLERLLAMMGLRTDLD